MNKYVQAFLILCGIGFILLFGLAMLPILVALLGTVAGLFVAFLPAFILIGVVVLVARLLDKNQTK